MASDISLPGPFWLIGCGNMAGAMLEGWLARGAEPSSFTVIRPSGGKAAAPGVRILSALPEDEVPALVMLGVKPQNLEEVAPVLAPALDPATVLISILAGVELAALRERFPTPRAMVRAMPNLPVALNKGVVGLCADGLDASDREAISELMTALGHAEWLDNEADMDVLTALAGSGPAFLYRFIDALAGAGETLGLAPDQARRLAIATIEGAAALAARSGEDPATLADRVASRGGSTRAGLDVLDREPGLAGMLRETLVAAVRRNREMAEEARRR